MQLAFWEEKNVSSLEPLRRLCPFLTGRWAVVSSEPPRPGVTVPGGVAGGVLGLLSYGLLIFHFTVLWSCGACDLWAPAGPVSLTSLPSLCTLSLLPL